MSLRSVCLVVALVVLGSGCGGPQTTDDEPTTAKEKQEREAEAAGEKSPRSKSWGGWRYKGDRNACFFIVGGKCHKTEKAACRSLRCKKPTTCTAVGAAPAQVSCK